MCLVHKDVLMKEKMLRNRTKWNEVASFLVTYFQHLFKFHCRCFWFWEIKFPSEITNKISIRYSKTQKEVKKHPFHGRRVNFERRCRINGERGTNVKYSSQYENIHKVCFQTDSPVNVIKYIHKNIYMYICTLVLMKQNNVSWN